MLLAIAIGVVGGAVAGLLAAIGTLASRRWRNGRLTARGEPAIKDATLPRQFVPFAAFTGGIVAAGFGTILSPPLAGAIGAGTPWLILTVIAIGAAVSRS